MKSKESPGRKAPKKRPDSANTMTAMPSNPIDSMKVFMSIIQKSKSSFDKLRMTIISHVMVSLSNHAF